MADPSAPGWPTPIALKARTELPPLPRRPVYGPAHGNIRRSGRLLVGSRAHGDQQCPLCAGTGLGSPPAVGRRSASPRTENQRRAFAAGHGSGHRPSVGGVPPASSRRGPVNLSTADLPLTKTRARLPDTASCGGGWSLRRLGLIVGGPHALRLCTLGPASAVAHTLTRSSERASPAPQERQWPPYRLGYLLHREDIAMHQLHRERPKARGLRARCWDVCL